MTERLTSAERAWGRLEFDIAEAICQAQERTKLTDSAVAKRAGMHKIRFEFIKAGKAPAVKIQELVAVARALGCRLHLFLADEATDEWATKHAVAKLRSAPKPVKPRRDWLARELEKASAQVASWPTVKKAAIVKQRRPA